MILNTFSLGRSNTGSTNKTQGRTGGGRGHEAGVAVLDRMVPNTANGEAYFLRMAH